MIEIKRNDDKETTGSLFRRFNRAVQQSGVLFTARNRQFFKKPISKRERRLAAIKRRRRGFFRNSDGRSHSGRAR